MPQGALFSLLVLFLLLFILSAFFAAAETAYSGINKIRMKRFVEEGRPGSPRALELTRDFNRTLSTVLIGGNIVDIVMTALATAILTSLFGAMGAVYSTVLMTILIILFGEILPKAFVKDRSEEFALSAATPLGWLVTLFRPFTWFTLELSRLIRRWTPGPSDNLPSVTHDELLSIVDSMNGEGVLPRAERELIENAINFNELEVWEIQTPRVDLFALNVREPLENVRNLLVKNHYSRVPVYEGTVDNIVGFLNEKDFLSRWGQGEAFELKAILTRPLLIAGSASLMDAFRILQKSRSHMAVVLDEYGGTSGIITMEDILEELVGDIYDEHDDIKEYFTQVEENVFLVNAEAYLEELFVKFLHRPCPESESSTFGGWLLEQFTILPEAGASVRWEDLTFQIVKVAGQRIQKIRIIRERRNDGGEEAGSPSETR
ncbi:HlyC/CorC family transporter [Aminithiophilus ramosus]|uniref:HlyC/CorC family transporter n=2 Tax=Synergistales TaxID=649776 RepID=A0A9Q7AI48_9BACT|nr:hemolysin family protein [Aminithiophilus ramosus]QTX33379.1 HlyC/CorC family transporter [Aminithiophilus ramosus]QVL36873.1 HlyC/CorC family transporter [Synergistota bacterium]